MDLKQYLHVREAVLTLAENIENKKRMSYTAGAQNVLHNFVSDSEFVGTNQLQNALTHFMKQVRGVSSYVKHPDVEPSESLMSRAADLINYTCLMVANAIDMGRDVGEIPMFHPNKDFFSFVAKAKEDEPLAKVATDFYDYNFGPHH